MTRYTVVWDDDIETTFTNAWIASDSRMRAVLTEIANWIDTNLPGDADMHGQPRADLAARTIEIPLSNSDARVVVTYRVLPDDRQVRVIRLTLRSG